MVDVEVQSRGPWLASAGLSFLRSADVVAWPAFGLIESAAADEAVVSTVTLHLVVPPACANEIVAAPGFDVVVAAQSPILIRVSTISGRAVDQ